MSDIKYWFYPDKINWCKVRVLVGKHKGCEGYIRRREERTAGVHAAIRLENGKDVNLHLKNVELI